MIKKVPSLFFCALEAEGKGGGRGEEEGGMLTFVDQCFTQCLLARIEERGERGRQNRIRKEQERRRESEKEKEEN